MKLANKFVLKTCFSVSFVYMLHKNSVIQPKPYLMQYILYFLPTQNVRFVCTSCFYSTNYKELQ